MIEAISDSEEVPAITLAALEELLSSIHIVTQSDAPALAQLMGEAVTMCDGRHAVHGGINLNLQAALASIRQGRPEDAPAYIETALEIHRLWVGAVI